ncbi:hypothetical protein CFP56_003998 [Quercus suber]|uniref:Uncharacterized protein n=1 Tax=Quercus suber TaxID=58331 RepID=A0AAW0LDB2_QUESU
MTIWLSSMAVVWKKITEFWSTTILKIIASHKLSLVNKKDSSCLEALVLYH